MKIIKKTKGRENLLVAYGVDEIAAISIVQELNKNSYSGESYYCDAECNALWDSLDIDELLENVNRDSAQVDALCKKIEELRGRHMKGLTKKYYNPFGD